jgi:uncharacterized protein (DUF486 family)
VGNPADAVGNHIYRAEVILKKKSVEPRLAEFIYLTIALFEYLKTVPPCRFTATHGLG